MNHTQLHPTELALLWPTHAEDQFAQLFARALQTGKATVWLPDPTDPRRGLRLVGATGLTSEERALLEDIWLDPAGGGLFRKAQQEPLGLPVWSSNPAELGHSEVGLLESLHQDTLVCCALRVGPEASGLVYAGLSGEGVPQAEQRAEAALVAQALSMGLQHLALQRPQQKTDHQLQLLLDHTSDLVFLRKDMTLLQVNPACEKVLGYTPQEMVGQDFTRFLHPADLPGTLQAEQQVLQGIPVEDLQGRAVHKNGSVVHLSWTHIPGQDGTLLSIGRDITGQTHQQALLQQSEQRLHDHLDGLPILIWMSDLSKDRMFFNKTWLEFTGQDEGASTEEGWSQFVHSDDLQSVLDTCHLHFHERTPFQIEHRLRRFDGQYRWIELQGVPRFSAGGEFEGFTGSGTDIHDHKLLEEALQESRRALEDSEARFKAVTDNVPILIWMSDLSKDRMFFNKTWLEFTGSTQQDSEGFNWTQYVHPGDLHRYLSLYTSHFESQQPFQIEYRLRRFDGQYRWILATGVPRYGSQGEFQGFIGGCIEMHDRKMAERALQESRRALEDSEARFKAVTDNVPILVWMSDLSKGRVFFNKTWLEFTGQDEGASMGEGWTQFVHSDDLQDYLDTYHLHFHERTPFQIEYRLRRFDGQYRWILATGVPRYGSQGEFQGFIGGCIEMHDRKIAQEALQESERRFKVIADNVPIFIWMSDQNRGRMFFNKAWVEFIGKPASVAYGTGWTQFVHPDDVDRYLDAYHRHFDQRTPFQIEYRLRRHDGEYRWILANCVPRFSPGGEFLGYIGGCIEMHERKMALEQLKHNESQLRELMDVQKRFVADAAHEIRTPLAAIQGNLDILIRYPHIDNQEKLEIVRDVQQEASRLGRLVHDMLQLARGDSGLSFKEEEVLLHEVLLEAWRETERLTSTHQMVLGKIDPLTVLGDRDRLKQLALILLENALKYTPSGGTIHLSLAGPEGGAEIRLADTGVGIPPEDLDRVFERFYRVDKARHRGEDPGGTGLGLPIARWIVEQHGGHIWLESELGKGTTVVVQLKQGDLDH